MMKTVKATRGAMKTMKTVKAMRGAKKTMKAAKKQMKMMKGAMGKPMRT